MQKTNPVLVMVLLAVLGGCEVRGPGAGAETTGSAAAAGENAMDVSELASNIRILSSDEFAGRKPDSPGEQLTVDLLVEQFRALGLQPANHGSFVQEVPLTVIEAGSDARLSLRAGATTFDLANRRDQVSFSRRSQSRIEVDDSEVVFVGYGINAPERGWNDYQGVDVRGKTVLMLINDPGFGSQDPALFNGNAMTYYGRWDYKFDEAARQGASGAIIIHDSAAATYPWRTVRNSWSGKLFHLVRADGGAALCKFQSWISNESARSALAAAGQDLDELAKAARTPGFRAVPLAMSASVSLHNTVAEIRSRNVAAILPGRTHPQEAFIYMAHWDHIGSDPDVEPGEDGIFNGALDNASGTAGLIELARAFSSLPQAPERSLLFLSVTAEEQGLLGSSYYAAHPLVPLAQTVGGINMDGLNNYGPTWDLTVIGHGNSELDAYLSAALGEGRRLRPYPFTERGSFYRSDQFELAKAGVPMLYAGRGVDHKQHGEAWGLARDAEYIAERYHGPKDEWSPDWDLSGAIEDLQVLYRVGFALANSRAWPQWSADSEFKAVRDAQRPL
jgi:Zn-dependent M28 family amino/carboxypeptidase